MKAFFTIINTLFLVIIFSNNAYSQCSGTATALTSGDCCSGGGQATWDISPSNACTIIIPPGISVNISSTTTWAGNVEVSGNLALNGQLRLGTETGCGLTLKIFGSGLLAGDGANDRLVICGQTVVTGQPNPPAGAIDWPADGSFSAGDLGGNGSGFGQGGILPIELIDFSSRTFNNSVEFSWATASETNFDYFSLQRSANGKDFTEIAQIKGNGTTNERHDYSYEDRFPLLGKSYYRLTSVDFDGYTETFDVISVTYNGEKSARVFPNPAAEGKINIELSYTPTETVNVLVTDLNGVEKGRYQTEGQTASFTAELNPGTYLVKVSSGDFSKVMRVVVK